MRRAFAELGHDAWSCDLLPARDGSACHIQGDVRPVLQQPWDLVIAFPPCQYLCSSGLHWNHRRPGRQAHTEAAADFFMACVRANAGMVAVENSIGCMSTRYRPPDQIIQPWWFGDDASKATCLWLKNLSPLKPTDMLPGDRRTRRANQTASGQNKLGPSPERARLRATTYPGIAAAMADQWGRLPPR